MSEALAQALMESVAPHNPGSQTETPSTEQSVGGAPEAGEQTPEQKQAEAISPRLSAIIKREAALIKRERELKTQMEQLQKSGEGKLSREELIKTLQDEYEEDPYEFMNKHNFSYEKLQNRILGGDEGLKITKLEKKIESLMSQIENKEKAKQTQDEQDEETQYNTKKDQAIGAIEAEIAKLGDKFELIQNEGAFNHVYDVIQEMYLETGKLLTISEAAELVENQLEEDFKKRLEYKKVKGWTTPTQKVDESITKSNPSEQLSPKPTETKTITSDMISASGSSKSDLELTDEERTEKAIRALRGQI